MATDTQPLLLLSSGRGGEAGGQIDQQRFGSIQSTPIEEEEEEIETVMAAPAKPQRWIIFGAVILAQVIFGAFGILMEVNGRHQVNSFVFAFYQRVLTIPVFMAAIIGASRCTSETLRLPIASWQEFGVFLFMALMLTLQLIGYTLGNYHVGAAVASAFQPLIPCWGLIISVASRTEPPPRLSTLSGWLAILGVLCAVDGCSLITLTGGALSNTPAGHSFLFGIVMLLINTSSFAVYVVCQRYFIYSSPQAPLAYWADKPLSNTFWPQALAVPLTALSLIDPALTEGASAFVIPPFAYGSMAYGSILATLVAMCLITFANQHEHPSIVTSFWPAQVIATVLFSWLFFGQGLSWVQWIGCLLIFVGLFGVLTGEYLKSAKRAKDPPPIDSSHD